MHTVIPDIVTVSSNRDINLDRINKFTITNIGSTDLEFGFSDSMVVLHQGQSTGFESGANAWFDKDSVLKLRFVKGNENDSHEAIVILCKVLKPSNIFQDALK